MKVGSLKDGDELPDRPFTERVVKVARNENEVGEEFWFLPEMNHTGMMIRC